MPLVVRRMLKRVSISALAVLGTDAEKPVMFRVPAMVALSAVMTGSLALSATLSVALADLLKAPVTASCALPSTLVVVPSDAV